MPKCEYCGRATESDETGSCKYCGAPSGIQDMGLEETKYWPEILEINQEYLNNCYTSGFMEASNNSAFFLKSLLAGVGLGTLAIVCWLLLS